MGDCLGIPGVADSGLDHVVALSRVDSVVSATPYTHTLEEVFSVGVHLRKSIS